MRKTTTLITAIFLLSLSWGSASEQKTIRLTDLNDRGLFAIGDAINASRQVTGSVVNRRGNRVHAYFWHGVRMRDLGTFGGFNSFGQAINAAADSPGPTVSPM
jgi:probable HAF family extracellular repeat protein